MTERQIEEIVETPEIGWSVASGQLTGASINPHPLGKPIIVSIETASHSQPYVDRLWRAEIISRAPQYANAFSQGSSISTNTLGDYRQFSPIQYYRI